MRRHLFGVFLFSFLFSLFPLSHLTAEADRYDIYAVRYATLANFPMSSLVAGADRSRRMDIAMPIWVLKGAAGRLAIVDSGFHRDQYFKQFTFRDFGSPAQPMSPPGLHP